MARLLIIGGGERGIELARTRIAARDVARIVAVNDNDAAAIEAVGAEPWHGDPSRLATIVGALEGVAVVCWLLADVGATEGGDALHRDLLESFLSEAVDTTMRGFVYERAGQAGSELLAAGTAIVERVASANAIPIATIDVASDDDAAWLQAAEAAVASLLGTRDALDSN